MIYHNDMKYSSYRYLFPPRPDTALPASQLGGFDDGKRAAQVKMNGTNNMIFLSPDKTLKMMTRHNTEHKAWVPKYDRLTTLTNIVGDGWFVFVSELMHSKTTHIKDTIYIHDILVNDGEYLVGYSQAQRQEILQSLFDIGGCEETISHYVIDDNIWLAKEYYSGFSDLFNNLDQPEYEGLVLKNRDDELGLCGTEKGNNRGLLKFRKAHKNYAF